MFPQIRALTLLLIFSTTTILPAAHALPPDNAPLNRPQSRITVRAEAVPDDWQPPGPVWDMVDIEDAWDFFTATSPGAEITVAVVDSGVAGNLAELQDALLPGWDFINDNDDPDDETGHGTHICSIIGAAGDNNRGIAGICWPMPIRILPLKFMEADAFNTTGTIRDAIEAIEHAVNQGADIINISWGSEDCSPRLVEALEYAGAQGVLCICSAGNNDHDNDVTHHCPSNHSSPTLIAVAALDHTGDELWSSSNHGRQTVHCAAPGQGLEALNREGGITFCTGTSYATAVVSGIAALLMSRHPELTAAEIRRRLLMTTILHQEQSPQVTDCGGCISAGRALAGGPLHALDEPHIEPHTEEEETPPPTAADHCLITTARH